MLLAYAINDSEEMVMKIAVTYENGEVFQHFGHTEAVYTSLNRYINLGGLYI